ncbi:MAG: hypothetical protein P8I38_10580 [Arenicella sp.]|nr:hypothetical protein [Arenicella sp.]HAU67314.1 hypothetical protein [Gammaproteobacteria bacterium]
MDDAITLIVSYLTTNRLVNQSINHSPAADNCRFAKYVMDTIRQLFEIITLRRKVGDLDYNPSVALIAGAVLVSLGAYINSLTPELSQPFAISLVQYIVQAALLYGLLSMLSKSSRFVQTASAIFGTTALLQIMALILIVTTGFAAMGFSFTIWNFYISIIILRDSLEITTLVSLLWTLALQALTAVIVMMLFPDFLAMIQSVAEQINSAQLQN